MASNPGFAQLSTDCWSLFGDIEPLTAAHFVRAIHGAKKEAEPLILLCSDGGDVHLTLALMAMIRKKLRPDIRATGYVCSAAIHLLQAGAVRTAYRGSHFYNHPFSDTAPTTSANFQSYGESFRRFLEKWTRVLAERTNRRARFWKDFIEKERFFDEDEALRLGLIDVIV